MLNIAVVAFNYELSCKAIKVLAENDCDSKIKIYKKDILVLEDNTKYIAFHNNNQVRGHCIDQIIIVDDFRWNIYQQESQIELLDWLNCRLDCTSYVPEEFQIIKYEW